MQWKDVSNSLRPKKILRGILASRRVANAYLFIGFEPEPKLKQALAFAQALLCEEQKIDPCEKCLACRKFQKGVHPDFMVIEPEGSSLKIEQLRQLKGLLHYSASEGSYRVVLVKEAQSLTVEAANSFLKNLEEPLPGIVFILLSSTAEGLPLTIVSRCQKLLFEEEPGQGQETAALLEQLEGFAPKDIKPQLDFAQMLIGIDPDTQALLLKLLSAHRQQLAAIVQTGTGLKQWHSRLNLFLDAYRKINLHANKRLVLENLVLNWGGEN